MLAGLVKKVKFVAGAKGSKKYSSNELFGNIACKIFYFRLDSPEGFADLTIQHIPRKKINEKGFECSLTHHLKRILTPDAYDCFVKNMKWTDVEPVAKPNSERDYYFQ